MIERVVRVWFVLSATVVTCSSATAAQPNVLFIAIDDLNDWTGKLSGHPQAKTPHIDRLVNSGIQFTKAYCAAPACNPSRAALLTGIRPSTSGVYFNGQKWMENEALAEAPTLPKYFRAHGYISLGSGKIFHGNWNDPHGWDVYWPAVKTTKPADPKPPGRPLNGLKNTAHFDWGPLDAREEDMGDWRVADWVIEQLYASHDKPFFLACGIFRPHLPWYVPEKYFAGFPLDSITLPEVPADDLDDVPQTGVKMAKPGGDHARVTRAGQWSHAVQGYLASIAFADACVGRVLDALEASGHRNDTIVVLWSDHGWHLGEKQHWRKFALWEEAARVQMIWRVPGLTAHGVNCDRTVSLLDIYPTLVDLCGLPDNLRLEGHSLRPLLENASAPWEHASLTTHGRNNHGVRTQRFRFIQYADGSEELYDHRVDPMEWENLAHDSALAEVLAHHRALLPSVNAAELPTKRERRSERQRR